MRPREVVIAFKENEKNKPILPLPKVLPLPDKHAYIRTATYAKLPIEYEELRTKAAISKRGIEASLSKYLAKTAQNTCNLFDGDDSNFLLISGTERMSKPAYLSALNPTDQVFDFEELEYYYELRNAKVQEDSEQTESPREYFEFEVSPQREENEINSDEIAEISQPSSVEKTANENPFQKLLSQ
jgi:transcription initiation factor TFIID subunit 8